MSRLIDLTGERFGRLVVEARDGSSPGSGNAEWLCLCDCGRRTRVNSKRLRRGETTSCGCYATELLVARSRTHGMRTSPTYQSWLSMRQRCTNPRAAGFDRYGGRGIRVCERWRSFESFLEDMGERPDGTSLDRLDNNGNYEPGNCRWATSLEQVRNQDNTRRLTHNGVTLTLQEWAERIGIGYGALYDRLRYGWSTEAALTTPIHEEKRRGV